MKETKTHITKQTNQSEMATIPTIRLIFQKTRNYRDNEKIKGCQGWVGEEVEQGICRASQWNSSLWSYNGGCTSFYVCRNPHQEWTRLWGIVMYQCRFISWNKWTTLVGDIDNGGEYVWGSEQRIYGKSVYLPFNFAVNLQLLSFF